MIIMELNSMKMLILILLIFTSSIFAEEQEKTVLDIKVALTESADLLPAQLGASVYLLQSDWARVSEIGEDAAIWLTNYDRKMNFIRQQVISLTLEIREPSSLRTGNLIAEENVVVRYWPSDTPSPESQYKIVQELEELSHELKLEAYYLGKEIEGVLRSHFR